jgi:hypothetical protein
MSNPKIEQRPYRSLFLNGFFSNTSPPLFSYQEFDNLFLDINGKQTPETELQNAKGATASEIAAPKPDLGANAKKDDFETLFKRTFKMKITSAKIAKIN